MHGKRSLTFLVVVVLALTGLTSTAASAQGSTETNFVFRGNGFGAMATANVGDLDGNVGPTAHSWLGCTRHVGVEQTNSTAAVDMGALIEVGATTTVNKSVRKNGRLHSTSINEVASVQVGTGVAHVEISGLTTVARTTWDGNEFSTNKWINIADVSLVVAGLPVPLTVDTFLDVGVEIPGVATIDTVHETGAVRGRGAWIRATALRIQLLGSAEVEIGQAMAQMDMVFGEPFGGHAFAANVEAVGDIVSVGPVARQPLPCPGTNGQWRETAVASVDNGILDLNGVSSRVKSDFHTGEDFQTAEGISEIASASILDGLVEIEGLRTEVLLRKNGDGSYGRYDTGTTFASLTVAGQQIVQGDFVDGKLTIPGVAELEFRRWQGGRQGVRKGIIVTGLVIELLDGVGATVEVGKVQLVIR